MEMVNISLSQEEVSFLETWCTRAAARAEECAKRCSNIEAQRFFTGTDGPAEAARLRRAVASLRAVLARARRQ